MTLPRSYLCHLRWWLCDITIVSLKLTRRACALTAWVPIIPATAPTSDAMARIGTLAMPQMVTLNSDLKCLGLLLPPQYHLLPWLTLHFLLLLPQWRELGLRCLSLPLEFLFSFSPPQHRNRGAVTRIRPSYSH